MIDSVVMFQLMKRHVVNYEQFVLNEVIVDVTNLFENGFDVKKF
jgi:hypothetical protein